MTLVPEPALTPEAAAAFVRGFHTYSGVSPERVRDRDLAKMLLGAWPSLDSRAKEMMSELERILGDVERLTGPQRTAADNYWKGIFGVVAGAVQSRDPDTRVMLLTEGLRAW